MKWGLRVMRIARWRRKGSKFVDFAIKAVLECSACNPILMKVEIKILVVIGFGGGQ